MSSHFGSIVAASLKPDIWAGGLWVPIMSWKRKMCWTADALRHLDSSLTPQYDSAPGLGSPKTLILRDEESNERDRPRTARRGLSQPAKPARESLVQMRLASNYEELRKQNT